MGLSPDDTRHLRRAIELSLRARSAGDQPFGSLLVGASGDVLAEDVNTEITENDITAHPELKLARWAGANLTAEQAAGTTMYTSCEACAMCSGAIVYSGLGRVVYALSTPEIDELKGGSAPKAIRGTAVLAKADRRIRVEGPFLFEEAAAPHFGYWVSE
jgi:tRNA(Arg) A34 adenosine deaminase TadA